MQSLHNPKAKSSSLAEAFASVLTFSQKKAKFPAIRNYCAQVLGLRFKGNHSFCPIHGGHGGHAFQIDDQTQAWQCWSECRERCPRHKDGAKADRSQPCICRGDVLDLHMLTHAFKSKREAIDSLIKGEGNRLPRSNAAKFFVDRTPNPKPKVNDTLIARISKAFSFVDEAYLRKRSPVHQPEAS